MVASLGCDDKITAKDNCGDGFLDPAEECDTGELNGATCISLGFYSPDGVLACGADCTFDTTGCGNAFCGNGLVDDPEACEGEQLRGATCESQGWYPGTLACGEDCQFDYSGCEGRCGDSVVQPEFEEVCDSAELGGTTCLSLGYYGGELACNQACAWDLASCEAAGRCGDGIVHGNQGEDCDSDTIVGLTCRDFGFWAGEVACTDCREDTSVCLTLVKLSTGGGHACALDQTGDAWCWGDNASGQLGLGVSDAGRSLPSPVAMPVGVTFVSIVSGSNFSCALDSQGTAWCWGGNEYGQTGTGALVTTVLLPTVVEMPIGVTFTSLHSGGRHVCALNGSGLAWCWGDNQFGQIGGTELQNPARVPLTVMMPAATTFATMSLGTEYSCAVGTTGQSYCWGKGTWGQLGTGSNTSADIPTAVVQSPTLHVSIHAGNSHTCAIDIYGGAWCWGGNDFGQLGSGNTTDRNTPVAVSDPTVNWEVTRMSVGPVYTCAIDVNGVAWCWGGDFNGALGNGPDSDSPVPVHVSFPASSVLTELSSGFYYSCALDSFGLAWCWGLNDKGQLGNGTMDTADIPGILSEPAN